MNPFFEDLKPTWRLDNTIDLLEKAKGLDCVRQQALVHEVARMFDQEVLQNCTHLTKGR